MALLKVSVVIINYYILPNKLFGIAFELYLLYNNQLIDTNMGGWILFIAIGLIGFIVQRVLKSKFEKYSKIPLSGNLTGAEIARRMLADNGIFNVQVVPHEGTLSDHYNPETRTVALSNDVFYSNSIAAAAVAAHECGHAVQHAKAYAFLTMRSQLVPIVSFASQWVQWVLLAGIFMINTFPMLIWIGIALFAMTTLFSFVTLPVEINASSRAMVWLSRAGITDVRTQPMAFDALKWAAYTYVVAALGSLATLIYYVMLANNRRN